MIFLNDFVKKVQTLNFILFAVLIIAGGLWADEPVLSTQPVQAQPATEAEDSDQTDEQKQAEAYKTLLNSARDSMVVVRTFYKKDLTDPTVKQDAADLYDSYIEKKRPAETTGVVIDAGLVIIADDGVEDRFVDHIEVEDSAGNKASALRTKLLYRAPNIILKLTGSTVDRFKPADFVPIELKKGNIQLAKAILGKTEDRWLISAMPILRSEPFKPARNGNQFFGQGNSYTSGFGSGIDSDGTEMIVNSKGKPVGCASSSMFDLRQIECIWHGADLIKADGLDWSKLQQAQAAVRKKVTPGIFKIILQYRKGNDDAESFYSSSDASGTEEEHFGFAISEKDIFVPMELTRKKASKITGIFVKFSPEKRTQAQFVGAYKGFGAFLIRLEDEKLPAYLTPALKPLERMVPFLAAQAIEKFGKKYLKIRTNRLMNKSRGYKGIYHWNAMHHMSYGTMLLDLKGQLGGVYLKQRREYAEQEINNDEFDYSYDDEAMTRIVTIDELRELLKTPEKFLDQNIKILQQRIKAERHAWLGVEFMSIDSKLAKFWKVEKPTKDGQVGLIINAVYPDSPAEELGLKPGDILLKIKAPGRDYPTELGKNSDEMDMMMRFRWAYASQMGEGELWKSRKNTLTELLDTIGVDKTVQITYCRRDLKDPAAPAEELTLDYTIALAPPDLASAKKWQNRKLGLTVKDMTYEVRYALGLTKKDPGVVVVKIENGSAAQIARILPMEIITNLDGQPLNSASQMCDLIAQARQAGKDKVRLTIQSMGKTRFVDLNISAYEPKDDEGMDGEKQTPTLENDQ